MNFAEVSIQHNNIFCKFLYLKKRSFDRFLVKLLHSLHRTPLVFVDDIADDARVIEGMGCDTDPEVGVFRGGIDRDDPEVKDIREDAFRLSIDLLYIDERALRYGTIQERNLLDTDDATVRDDEKIKLVIKPHDVDEEYRDEPHDNKNKNRYTRTHDRGESRIQEEVSNRENDRQ